MSDWIVDDSDVVASIPGIARDDDEDDCGVMRWINGTRWVCTRLPRHSGRHLATASGERVFAAWPGDHEPTAADLTGEA